MTDLPTGTVTFLFTDVEGSTRLLHELGDGYASVLAEHRLALREAFAMHGGVEVDTQGDAFFVAFAKASDALAAASAGQEALAGGPVRVRMGVHTGEPAVTDEGYVGIDVHRAARIAAAGHGGQILVSQAARDSAAANGLRDLGDHRLKDLSAPERIYQLGDGDFPPLKSVYNNNLPLPGEPLIGRKRESADVLRLFHEGARVVTVTGPGGIGKTRFALQVAAELIDDFKDGVWWIGLAALRDSKLVVSTIAATIAAQGELEHELRGKQLLLLLDNFEQVVEAAGELAALQAAASGVALLVTSREPLHIAGEREYPLLPLAESPAVELFRQRASAIAPEFTAEYRDLAALCDRVDRLPLAIELAAARTKTLSARNLLERLDERLPLLTTRRRDVDERQRTLRATIEWSYELLERNEKELFACLSVFAGGFDAGASDAVCDADIDTLDSLIDKSLLRRTADGRFFMLETIREFAQTVELTRKREVANRHAGYYLSFSERARQRGRDGDLHGALSLLDSVQANVRVALAYFATSGRANELARLIDSLAYYWFVRGQLREGDGWIQEALTEHRPSEPKLMVELLVWQSDFARTLADHARAHASADEALALSRRLHDDRLVARSLHELGESYVEEGDARAAQAAYEEAVETFRRAGESPANSLGNLGDLALTEGDFTEAARRLQEVRTLFAAEGRDAGTRLIVDHNFVVALLYLDRDDEARQLLKDVLARAVELGYLEGVALALLAAATALSSCEADSVAACVFGSSERILDETGAHIGPTERRLYDPLTKFVAERHLEADRQSGRELTTEAAVDFAMRSLG
jgi:predicted ATPase